MCIFCVYFPLPYREEWKIITCAATGATVTSCALRLCIYIKYQVYSVHICSFLSLYSIHFSLLPVVYIVRRLK